MKLVWFKAKDSLGFSKPIVLMILGVRDSGKSSLLETLGEYYLQKNHSILDLFGSRDGESLAWLRSPWVKDRKVLLIRGDNTDVESSWNSKQVSSVTLKDVEDHDITISSSPLYSDPDTEFLSVAHLTDLVYRRLSWKRIIYAIVREASNLYYSRLKVTRNQQMAKSQEIYLLREARHMGLSMGLDTLKFTSVDIDVRAVSDFMAFKSLGLMGLPRDLKWLYGYIDPAAIRHMKKQEFILLSKTSAAALGTFSAVPWHKQEKENILNQLGLKVEHGEPLQQSADRGTYLTVSDREHASLVEEYAGGLGMAPLSEKIGRSSRTVSEHLHKHDDAVERSGFCPRCERTKSQYSRTKILRTSS